MGRLYRARDTKLNRDVALKVLPDSFANDPDRLARFIREAQTLASLNHSNIAHIHGLEESGGVRALVMELVEGKDLAQRITDGAIPLDEALPIAKQIAEALEAAHEQGIIHRDLKPANIKVRPDGTVKVLDFGLAKAMEPVGSAAKMSQSPTITTPAMMTGVGVILGTAAYMSPEQARGKTVDKRTDIWSFGCVLYQMLTGRSAFAGETVSDTIVAILEREPDWNELPDATLPAVRRLLQRCLEKDPKRRLHDVADVRIEVEDALATPTSGGGSAGPGLAPGVIGPASSRASPQTLVWAAATFAMAVAKVGVLTGQASAFGDHVFAGLLSTAFPRIGRAMGAGSSTTAPRRPAGTFGRSTSRNGSRDRSWRSRRTNCRRVCRRMAGGWPTPPTSRACGKSTCSHSPRGGESGWCPQAAAPSRSGAATAKNYSTLRLMTISLPYRFAVLTRSRSESASRYSPRAFQRCWRRFAPTMRSPQTVSGFSSTTSRRKRRPRPSQSR